MLHSAIIELSKKRKSLDKQLDLPTTKHRFRDRSSPLEHLSGYAEDLEVEKVFNTRMKGLINATSGEARLEQHGSFAKDTTTSFSFRGETAWGMSHHAADNKSGPSLLKVYTSSSYDQPNDSEPKTPKLYACSKPSTSTGSCGSNSPMTMYNTSIETIWEEESPPCTEEHQHPQNADNICSDSTADTMEECLDDESEDMMLYSNGVSSDLFVLSSGRWKMDQAPQSARKPTIDKEFEEYFSMLML